MQWHKKPALQLVVMLCVMSAVFSLQNSVAQNIFNVWKKGQYAEVSMQQEPKKVNTGMVRVQAAGFREGAALVIGETEKNKDNMLPRCPISDSKCKGYYDVLNPAYFRKVPDADGKNFVKMGGQADGKVYNMFGQMFGYRPKTFVNAYKMKYIDGPGQGIRQGDSEIKGNAPIVEVPTRAGSTILKMPDTGYDVGGGDAMVAYATNQSVTLHIGRHEYFGPGPGCGGICSGGYWIYLSGLDINRNIVDAYNSVAAEQNAAKADYNPIHLPIVPVGYSLGKATGSTVTLALMDNGPYIAINKINDSDNGDPNHTNKAQYWGDAPEVDFGTGGAQDDCATKADGASCNYGAAAQIGYCMNKVCSCWLSGTSTPACPASVQASNIKSLASGCSCGTQTACSFGSIPSTSNKYLACHTPAQPPPPQGGQCFTLSAEIFPDKDGGPTSFLFSPHVKVFSPEGGKDGDVMASFLDGGSWINNGTFIRFNKGVQNPIDIDIGGFTGRAKRRFPNSLGVDELTDTYKIKIDNCAPLANEATITCKMGVRNGTPFVESVSGGECRCMGDNCTAPPPQASPSPEASPPPVTSPPEASPEPEVTGPQLDVDNTTFIITIADTCAAQACQDLRSIVDAGKQNLESTMQLSWVMDGSMKESSINSYTLNKGQGIRVIEFDLNNNPNTFPADYDSVDGAIYLQIDGERYQLK